MVLGGSSGGRLGTATLDLRADASKLDKGLDKVEKDTLKRMSQLGKRLTLSLTVPIVAIGASVFHAVETFDEAMARLRVGTGAAGDELKNLEKDFKAVFGTVPAGANTIADAMAELNTRLGFSGKSLQDATRNAVELGEIMRIDATQAIQKVAQTMAIFQSPAEEFRSVLDKMFVTSQKTGIGIDALTANLQAYGPVLKNASFTMDESIAIFGQLERAGADASRVFPGLNAFFRKAADNGQDLRKSLASVISRMKDATDDARALSIATEAFGAEGAQRMTTAVRAGAFEIDELVKSLGSADGAIAKMAEETRTNTQRIKIFQRRLLELQVGMVDFLGPAGLWVAAFGGVFAGIGPILIALPHLIGMVRALTIATLRNAGATVASTGATVAKTVATAAVTVATAAWTAAQWLLNAALTANPIGLVIVAVGALIVAVVLLVKHWDTITATIKKNWDIILAILFPGVGIAVLMARRWGAIKSAITGILNNIKSVVIDFAATIREILFGLLGVRFFSDLFDSILGGFLGLKEGLSGALRRPGIGAGGAGSGGGGTEGEPWWERLFHGFLWEDIIRDLIWRDFINGLVWQDFIHGLIWEDFMKGFLWETVIKGFLWNTVIEGFLWSTVIEGFLWSTVIHGFLWNTVIEGFLWSTVIHGFLWNTVIEGFLWSTVIHGFLWNTVIEGFLWSTVIHGFLWSTVIHGFLWSTVIKDLFWTTFIKNLVWSNFIKPIGRTAADIGRGIGGAAVDIGRGMFSFIPTRDTGGIVTSPQLAALSMNSRPEAIIPLDRLPEMMDGRGGLTVHVHVTGDVNGVEKLREIIRQGILDGDRRGLEHAF